MIVVPRASVDLIKAPHVKSSPAWEPTGDLYRSGHYAACTDESLRATFAHVRCAFGHVLRVSGTIHRVAADGTVSPSFVCSVPGCSWHVYVRLDGWVP